MPLQILAACVLSTLFAIAAFRRETAADLEEKLESYERRVARWKKLGHNFHVLFERDTNIGVSVEEPNRIRSRATLVSEPVEVRDAESLDRWILKEGVPLDVSFDGASRDLLTTTTKHGGTESRYSYEIPSGTKAWIFGGRPMIDKEDDPSDDEPKDPYRTPASRPPAHEAEPATLLPCYDGGYVLRVHALTPESAPEKDGLVDLGAGGPRVFLYVMWIAVFSLLVLIPTSLIHVIADVGFGGQSWPAFVPPLLLVLWAINKWSAASRKLRKFAGLRDHRYPID